MLRRFFVLAAVLLLFTAAACSSETDSPDPGPGDETAMGHIHGIGIDPADDTLYVATHFGLFHLTDRDQPQRVADRWQDTMAFTVVGDHHFLGSGHPDLRENRPPHLGLIESADAGETWESVALEGEADFHALEAAGTTLYAYDAVSGSLMTSTDRRTFRAIAQMDVADLAVDPADAGRVLATTESGLMVVTASTGERTPLASSPLLAFIDWPTPDLLVGLSPDGRVQVSHDAGETWAEAGMVPGRPAALEVAEDSWYAATDTGLYRSVDAGATWQPVAPG